MCTEAVQDKADALLHLLNHSAGFCILNNFTGTVLGNKGRLWLGCVPSRPRPRGGTLWRCLLKPRKARASL
jgi:hypothetical protein